MILIIDNYDSFVYNLARYSGQLGKNREVLRNNDPALKDIRQEDLDGIIISPGPCTPEHAGYSKEIIRKFRKVVPILGVCLGHQCIGEVYGGRTIRANRPMHGKSSNIMHNGEGLFMGLPDPLRGARYHSLVCDLPEDCPLRVTAQSEDGHIMAFDHKTDPVQGIQFHPESILTDEGIDIMRNFFIMADSWNSRTLAA